MILLWLSVLFLVIFNSFFIIPVIRENIKVKLALAIPAETPSFADKKIKNNSYQNITVFSR